MNNVKKSIGLADFTLNPVKGLCPMVCKDNQGKEYCYAARPNGLYKRFKWNPEIRFEPIILSDPFCYSKPSKIFIGSTMELFGDWVKPAWLEMILEFCQRETNKRHIYIFLTKQPQNLRQYSPFPPNCWVGVSVPKYWDDSAIGHPEAFQRISQLGEVRASVKFVSFEPLLAPIASEFDFGLDMALKAYGISWVIIGQQTPVKLSTMPKIGWVEEIIGAADKAGIPVFLKDNLISCVDQYEFALKDGEYRQEFPKL